MSQIARSSCQIGNIIQRARRQRGLNQTQLAGLAGLRQEMVSKVETGHEGVKISTIFSLLAALKLELVVENRTNLSVDDFADAF